MYVDPDLNHKLQSNRIFLEEGYNWNSGPDKGCVTIDGRPVNQNWNVNTWGMTKARCEALLADGSFDSANIANDDDAKLGAVKDGELVKSRVKSSAYSVSQYFRLANESTKKYLAIRSSGYAKFADTQIPARVLGMNSSGSIPSDGSTEPITAVGIFGVYDGDPQLTLIDIAGVLKPDGKTPWYKEDGSVNE